MRIQSNLRADLHARFIKTLASGETEAGFVAAAVEREILRRERGGKVVVTERKPGRPRKVSEQSERPSSPGRRQ